jgi:hypothetical protein
MPLRRYLHFIVALLLLAFIGQLVSAAAMTCEIKMPEAVSTFQPENSYHHTSETPMHDMADMDHSSHTDTTNQQHSPADCCKTMGHCLLACTVAVTGKDNFFAMQKQISIAMDIYSRTTPAPLASSHYRPPIFS